ncbi:4-hydroxy-tetrahydrodipicolinate synthase [Dokdonella koreensis]|uniref:4-hydroxy-tetrahydrodipicolinate synthase n=1 Tax=Dokdonella koreensis DS-123 TaxID=1300342 RepID=A0A160DVU9_9GAMM|nr:4-hydroxy-tetrahydrodipicolinate synthase [Dokdonella koreensis]ANB18697.1 Dihydrodipicolinate synthase [Dokdonella koreensis DS-123]
MNLSGSICALATPFRMQDGELPIDFEAFGRLIDHQVAGGTRALVAAGSTGEAAMLDDAEFSALVAFTVERAAGRIPVLAGTGQASTRRTIEQTRRAADAGAGAALVVTPPYVRPTQEGLYRHFMDVAEHGRLPVVLYNVPGRTACDLLPETVERLAAQGNIVAIKEARADAERMERLLAARPTTRRFAILSGDDPTCVRAMLAGADGVISVAANVAPAALQAIAEACADADRPRAEALDAALQDLYALLAAEPNPIPVKWCLARLGLGGPDLRLPLLRLSAAHHRQAERVLAACGLAEPLLATG